MRRLFLLLFFFPLVFIALAEAQSPQVDVLRADGAISPPVARYIERGIKSAEDHNAVACIIELDTPGGVDTSMRDIVQYIVNAKIPVIVYVSPAGARAASAGTFITMAAHIAAMAPNTAIGAAHPVMAGGMELPEDMEEKVVNDAVAYIKSTAQSKGRNVEWAEKAIRESASATAEEAVDLNVIDLMASNTEELLSLVSGREVKLIDGTTVVLNTQNAALNYNRMNWAERFLLTLADPNVCSILFIIGLIGIAAEIFHPGMMIPGILGGVCLLLSLYGLTVLPVNIAGILLILLAIGLFVAEIFTPTFGVLTAGGVASLIFGSMILFSGKVFEVSLGPIIGLAVICGLLFFFLMGAVVRTQRRRGAIYGQESMIGKIAEAKTALNPKGTVLFDGERWGATSEEGRIEKGEEVVITQVSGLKLKVKKKEEK
jgi:membrane-bound serine protease (ClpP class)